MISKYPYKNEFSSSTIDFKLTPPNSFVKKKSTVITGPEYKEGLNCIMDSFVEFAEFENGNSYVLVFSNNQITLYSTNPIIPLGDNCYSLGE